MPGTLLGNGDATVMNKIKSWLIYRARITEVLPSCVVGHVAGNQRQRWSDVAQRWDALNAGGITNWSVDQRVESTMRAKMRATFIRG